VTKHSHHVNFFVDRGRGRSLADYIDTDGPCWLWTGARNVQTGYGVIRVDGKLKYAHRYVWESLVGPIPDGLHIDHLCINRPCVNPDHLEPVSVTENNRRQRYRAGPPAENRKKTHCLRGHPFDEENTHRRTDGGRRCRICSAESARRRGASAKDAA
jgi:hypothetical protein